MMTTEELTLSKASAVTNCTVALTGSKSESNRALILRAVSRGKVEVKNLSSADDTLILMNGLAFAGSLHEQSSTGPAEEVYESNPPQYNIGPAGTAMRFLSAYFAVMGTEAVLTGSERMKQRPIGILADALRELGAKVSYTGKEGFPPLRFYRNFTQKSKQVRIKGDVSSQYITALLLVAASLPQGLELIIEGELTSRPYVAMTLAMLKEAGISYRWEEQHISVPPQPFRSAVLTVEPDWSAASYWYSIAALSAEATISLPWLKQNSLQGDSRISRIMEKFGISTEFTAEGIKISRQAGSQVNDASFFDLKDCPDLAQTVIVCSAALGNNATFTGLETLKIKETDRIMALQNELSKIGVRLTEDNKLYRLDCSGLRFPESVTIKTYEDHRMAMAFAPLALKIKELHIEDPGVVGKSYPAFWDDLKNAGFTIIETPPLTSQPAIHPHNP